MEVDSLRSENHSLKLEESQAIVTMRQNAQVASEYLNRTAVNAHTYIRSVVFITDAQHTHAMVYRYYSVFYIQYR